MKSNEVITLVLCCLSFTGLSIYYYFKPLGWNTEINPFLVDDETGKITEAIEFVDLGKLIKQQDTYLNSTSPTGKLFDLVQQENYEVLFHPDQFYASEQDLLVSSLPVVNLTKCSQDLRSTLAYLDAHSKFRLEKGKQNHQLSNYMDSFGKPGARLFSGTVRWVGSYDQCMTTKLQLDDNQHRIRMRYCWSRWTFNDWPREHRLLRPKSQISFGACLPESCDSRALADNKPIVKELITRDWSEFYKSNLQLNELFCLPDERSPLRQMPTGSYIYLGFVATWLALVLLSLLLNAISRNKLEKARALQESNGDAIVAADKYMEMNLVTTSLSVGKTIKKFALNPFDGDQPTSSDRVNMGFLSFIKSIFYLAVVIGHSVFHSHVNNLNIETHLTAATDYLGTFVIAIPRLIDTFFIMFGLLASYNASRFMMGKREISFWKVWIGFVYRTNIRILPMYLLVLGYIVFVNPYISAGPWWDYGTSGTRTRMSLCKNQPTYYMTLLSTTFDMYPNLCMPQSWFLACYFAWGFVCPVVIWLIVKLPNEISRMAFVALLSILPTLKFAFNLMKQRTLNNEAFVLYGPFLATVFPKYQHIVAYNIYDSVGFVAIGCYAGYLLYRYHIKDIKEWPRWMLRERCIWFMHLMNTVIFISPVIGSICYRLAGTIPTTPQMLISASILRLLWPISNCIVILSAATIYKNHSLIRFSSHSVWHVINKLGYGIYLVHWDVLIWAYSFHDQAPSYGSILDVLKSGFFAYAVSGLIAFALQILYELPVNQLITSYFQRKFVPKDLDIS